MASDPAPTFPGFAQRVLFAVAIIAAALLLWRLRVILVMAFLAILLSVFLRLLADPLIRFARAPAWLAVLVALGVLIGVVAGVILLAGNELGEQLRDLRDRLPRAWTQVEAFAQQQGLPLDRVLQDGGWNVMVRRAAGLAGMLAGLLAQGIVVFFGALFLAIHPELYRSGLLAMIPKGETRHRIHVFLTLTASALRQWLIGQLTSMAIIGVLVSLALMALNLPGALALGVFTGVAEFVPYVGAISAGLIATLVALSVSPHTAMITLLAYIAVQQLEGNLLTPLVMRKAVRLAPALNIFALASLAAILGPAGVFIAIPFTMVVMVAVKYFWVRLGLGEQTHIPGEESSQGESGRAPSAKPG